MPDKKEELKKCPFCGSEARYTIAGDPYNHRRDYYSAECTMCGTSGKEFTSFDEAIAAWNNRQPDKELIEALEEIVCAKHVPDGDMKKVIRLHMSIADKALAKYKQ